MIRNELDAAGIDDPRLREGYRRCREVNAAHGRTFFLATRLLAPDQRPPIHALYGFARYADDILDDLDSEASTEVRAQRLQRLSDRFFAWNARGDEGVEAGEATARGWNAPDEDPILRAVVHTSRRYDISAGLFEDFLESMRMDLVCTDYPDRAALNRYMRGSAEAIGLQLLPILGTSAPAAETEPYAAALGRAFQLTNFLRDVDEDLDRGRVYLPADELAAHGVDREMLLWCHAQRRTDPRVRKALAAQHEITRATYREAEVGIGMLAPRSRPCVAAAAELYAEILDRIEASDFAVFNRRATVGTARRLQVAGVGLIRSWRARSRAA